MADIKKRISSLCLGSRRLLVVLARKDPSYFLDFVKLAFAIEDTTGFSVDPEFVVSVGPFVKEGFNDIVIRSPEGGYFILEFQSTSPPDLVLRMQRYYEAFRTMLLAEGSPLAETPRVRLLVIMKKNLPRGIRRYPIARLSSTLYGCNEDGIAVEPVDFDPASNVDCVTFVSPSITPGLGRLNKLRIKAHDAFCTKEAEISDGNDRKLLKSFREKEARNMVVEYERELIKRGERKAERRCVKAMRKAGVCDEEISRLLDIPLTVVKAIPGAS